MNTDCYCTLFDKNYLDKGIVMIDSLISASGSCRIYVLCMDSFTYDALSVIYSKKIFLVSIDEILDGKLESVRSERTAGEFCWTCTAVLIRYILKTKKEHCCTYVDADLFFYINPNILIQEMHEHDCTVQVVPHWFGPSFIDRYREKESGKFCVQFNTFTSEERSMELLNEWINSCINDCSLQNHGDQLYINNWEKFDFVNVTEYSGAGVAPWNIKRYYASKGCVFDRLKKCQINLIFYHFQDIEYLDRYHIYLKPFIQHKTVDKKMYYDIYIPYLLKIEKTKERLEKLFDFVPKAGFIGYKKSNHKEKTSFLARIKTKFEKPFLFIIDDFFQKVRRITRERISHIDLTRYL